MPAARVVLDPETGELFELTHKLDEHGHEILDGTPIAPPIGYKKQDSIFDHVRNMIRSERLAMEVEAAGFETFEESEDFEIGDDFDPTTPYENTFDPSLKDIKTHVEAHRAQQTPQDGPSGRGTSQAPSQAQPVLPMPVSPPPAASVAPQTPNPAPAGEGGASGG